MSLNNTVDLSKIGTPVLTWLTHILKRLLDALLLVANFVGNQIPTSLVGDQPVFYYRSSP